MRDMADIKIIQQATKPGDDKRVAAEVEKLEKEGYEVFERNRRHVMLRKKQPRKK